MIATCINSPRKERKKGVKRGPYKKRQQQQQEQQLLSDAPIVAQQDVSSATAIVAPSTSAFIADNNTMVSWDNGNIEQPQYDTPSLTQQESPLASSSPLSADMAFGYNLAPSVGTGESSLLSSNFSWDDQQLLGLLPPEIVTSSSYPPAPFNTAPHYHPFQQEQPVDINKCCNYVVEAQQQPMCTCVIPPQQYQQETAVNVMMNQQSDESSWLTMMQPAQQQQQQMIPQQQHFTPELHNNNNNGFWQSFLSTA